MLQNELVDLFESGEPLNDMVRYHLQTGGKNIRATLAILEAENLSCPIDRATKWALACELLHNATLIHDDIQDHDPIRRGQISLWKKYGIEQAINAGDLLIFKAFRLAASVGNSALVDLLARSSEDLVLGQAKELSVQSCSNINYWDWYLEMINQKTGALFTLPIEGIHCLVNKKMGESYKEACFDLGRAYQIADDIKDYLGLKQKGQIQKDFNEKKINAFIAMLSGFANEASLVNDYFNVNKDSDDQKKIISEINSKIFKYKIMDILQDELSSRIENFKNHSPQSIQKLVLKYFSKNNEVMRGQNAVAAI